MLIWYEIHFMLVFKEVHPKNAFDALGSRDEDRRKSCPKWKKKECNTTMPHCVSWLLTFCQRKIRKYGWMILKTEFNFWLDYEMYTVEYFNN